MSHFSDINISLQNAEFFSNTKVGDMVIYTENQSQNIHVGTDIGGQSTLNISKSNVAIAGNFVPASNLAYDLGSSNFRFRDLYLSGNTIDLGGARLTNDGINNVIIQDADNNLKTLVINELVIGDSSTGNVVRLSSTSDTGALQVNNSPLASVASPSNITASNAAISGLLQSRKIKVGGGGASVLLNSMQLANALPITGGSLSGNLTVPSLQIGTFGPMKIAYGSATTASNGYCQVSYAAAGFSNVPNVVCTPLQQEGSNVSVNAQILSNNIGINGAAPTVNTFWILTTKTTNGNVTPSQQTVNWIAIGP